MRRESTMAGEPAENGDFSQPRQILVGAIQVGKEQLSLSIVAASNPNQLFVRFVAQED